MDLLEQALNYVQTGKIKEAEEIYLDILKTDSQNVQANLMLGSIYLQRKEFIAAKEKFTLAYSAMPDPLLAENLGLCYFYLNDFINALNYLEIAYNGNNDEYTLDLVIMTLENFVPKLFSEEKITYSKKLQSYYLKKDSLKENNLDLIRKIASLSNKIDDKDNAIKYFNKALAIVPNDYVALNNLGLIYEDMKDDNLAIEYYKKSLDAQSNFYALYNLGVAYRKTGEFGYSLKYLTEALKVNQTPKVYSAIGASYLIQKQFEKGYEYYSKRYDSKAFNANIVKIWDGSNQPDKTLQIYCDGGFGDVIMFSRYFEFFKKYFQKVFLLTPEPLKPLFQSNINIEQQDLNAIVEHDYDVLLMNLPYYLKMDFDNIPYPEGWIKADKEKSEIMKEKCFNTSKFKIGINRIGQNRNSRNFKHRSIDFQKISAIFDNDKCEFYNFSGEDATENNEKYENLHDVTQYINDFSDTAALIDNLDLMISIDSSIIHLAGAMGKKSFLLLPHCAEWRWFTDTKSTPWYNSVEIFKQSIPYSWKEPIEEVKNSLNNLV